MQKEIERELALEFVRVTEAGALACGRLWVWGTRKHVTRQRFKHEAGP